MGATGAPPPVIAVIDVLELARLEDHEIEALQLPPRIPWESWSYKKTDFSLTVAGAITASRQVLGGDCRSLNGWWARETTGTAAAGFRLHDGSAATGEVFVSINLAANESTRDWFGDKGIRCFSGKVYIEFISGSFEGGIYWR